MNKTLAFLPILLLGCFSTTTPPDRCAERQVCAPVDALGCCDGVGVEVSICEACPSGTVTETSCRTAGCTMGCETPIACRLDVGDGCCGDSVFTTSCDACPAGSIPATSCTGDFPACGCDDTLRPIRAPEQPPVPLESCRADLGNGCCGDTLGVEGPCGCEPGSILESECGQFEDVPGIIAPPCYEDLGGGCCGGPVEPAACGMCPPGSVHEAECVPTAGAPEPDPAPIAPPMAGCVEDLGGGCCGLPVAPNVCGMCPPGSVREDTCAASDALFPAPACREDFGGGCCGAPVPSGSCGMCPAGSVSETACVDFSSVASPSPSPEPGEAPGDMARPAPPFVASCYVVDDLGCCGEIVEANTCGECPAGSSFECLFC